MLLKNSHIIINKTIADTLFANESYVQVIYYPNEARLMVARDSDDLFRSFHKAKRELLKDKNLVGDKSVNIRELLMDSDADDTDRDLEYNVDEAIHILNVFIR